jgi:hypothetical protein
MQLTVVSVPSVAPPSTVPCSVYGNASSADEVSTTKVIFAILITLTIGNEFIAIRFPVKHNKRTFPFVGLPAA